MLNGDIDTVELEGQIVGTVSLEGDLLPIGPKGDKGDDGFSPVVTTSKSGKTTTIKFETATGNVYAYVQDGEDGQGSGDMLTDVYDQNKNGIVDNAEACNGHTLEKDVPADAVFTDTTYESKEAASGGIDVSLCTTGEKYTWNNKSDFSGSYNDLTNKPTIPTKTSDLTNDSGFINNTVNNLTNYTPTSSLSTVALTGSYSDLSYKPSIPSKTSDLTNDSGFIDKTVNDLTNYYKKSDTYTKTEANTLLGAKANSSDLATVATSGSYNDLSNKPTIPDELADLSDDSTHRLVSDTEKTAWNNKVDSTGDATTTGENTSFSLTNVLEAPLLMDLKGNTSQNGTPTPSSPITVNVVSGDNDIVVFGKNLFDMNTITSSSIITINNNQTLTINGTGVGGVNFELQNPIILKANTTYTMALSNYYANDKLNIIFRTTASGSNVISVNTASSSIIPSEDITLNYLRIFTDGTTTFSNYTTGISLINDNSATYEAYNGNTYPVNLPVENLISTANITTTELNGITISKVDNAVNLNGTSSAATTFTFELGNTITLKAGTTYTFSSSNIGIDAGNMNLRDTSNSMIIQLPFQTGSINYTPDYDITLKYIRFYVLNAKTLNNYKIYPQLELGSKANSYTPYGTTPIELCNIGDYQDYFYKQNGKWYLHKEIGKVDIYKDTNYQNIYKSRYTTKYLWSNNGIPNIKHNTYGTMNVAFCNYFTYASHNDLDNGTVAIGFSNGSDGIYFAYNNCSADDMKTFMTNHQVLMYYLLETATNTEITYQPLLNQLNAIEEAFSYEGTTNINQINNDLPFIIDATVFNNNYNGRYRSLKYMCDKISAGGNN